MVICIVCSYLQLHHFRHFQACAWDPFTISQKCRRWSVQAQCLTQVWISCPWHCIHPPTIKFWLLPTWKTTSAPRQPCLHPVTSVTVMLDTPQWEFWFLGWEQTSGGNLLVKWTVSRVMAARKLSSGHSEFKEVVSQSWGFDWLFDRSSPHNYCILFQLWNDVGSQRTVSLI